MTEYPCLQEELRDHLGPGMLHTSHLSLDSNLFRSNTFLGGAHDLVISDGEFTNGNRTHLVINLNRK